MAEDHRVVVVGARRPGCKRPRLALETALPRLRNCFRGRLEPGHPPAQATEHDAEVAATTAHIQQAARGALRKRAKGLACERSPADRARLSLAIMRTPSRHPPATARAASSLRTWASVSASNAAEVTTAFASAGPGRWRAAFSSLLREPQ